MKETKISLLRQFGTEQFSITISLDEKASQADFDKAIETVNGSVFKMLQNVENRAIQERDVLAQSAQKRTQSIENLNKELQSETEAKKKLASSVKEGEKVFKKLNK